MPDWRCPECGTTSETEAERTLRLAEVHLRNMVSERTRQAQALAERDTEIAEQRSLVRRLKREVRKEAKDA